MVGCCMITVWELLLLLFVGVMIFLFMILITVGTFLLRRMKEKGAVKDDAMIPCPYCGELMPRTAVFCPNCGARRKKVA